MNEPVTRKMEFVFTRIHFEGLFSAGASQQIKEFLEKSEDKFIPEGKFKWAFGDVGSLKIDDYEILFGRLGRIITQKFETIYDQSEHSYRKELIKSGEASYSNFFIVPRFNILAFEEKYNLGRNKFIKEFKTFWLKYNPAEICFEFLKDEVEIFELVRTWDRLTKASFELVPSNPSLREDWKSVDEVIRKAAAKRAKLEFQNKEGTLVKEGSIIQQSMSMAADGYGEFKLRGFKDNVGQSFSSTSKIIKKVICNVDDLKAIVGQIYQEIVNLLQGRK